MANLFTSSLTLVSIFFFLKVQNIKSRTLLFDKHNEKLQEKKETTKKFCLFDRQVLKLSHKSRPYAVSSALLREKDEKERCEDETSWSCVEHS